MITVLSALFFFAFFASAQSPLPALEVGLSETAPFAYSEAGEVRGVNHEILAQISEKSGIKFNYKLYPHLRLTNSLDSVSPDLTIFFAKSCAKFPEKYEAATNLYTATPTLFLKKDLTLKSEKLRIGIIRGTCLDLSKIYLKPEMITDISDMKQAVEMLRVGRLEGVCGINAVIQYSLKQNQKFQEKLFPIHTDSEVLQAVLCRKRDLSEDVKKKLDAAIQKIKFSPVY